MNPQSTGLETLVDGQVIDRWCDSYRRDVRRLSVFMEQWERAVEGFSSKQEVWWVNLERLQNYKSHFRRRWGFEALEQEVRSIQIDLARKKMDEPVKVEKTRNLEVLIGKVGILEKRSNRRKSKARLRHHFSRFKSCYC